MHSYYDATLSLIRERMGNVSPAAIAAGLRITETELTAKLSGDVVLTAAEMATLARLFGCPMSEIVA
ncbi:hypothetical protein VUN84_12400 [Micrococcaceae bacterium Sec5.8]